MSQAVIFMYKTLSQHYRETYGCKVYKLAIDGGFTCPNRDGTLGYGGCIFCSGSGSGDFAAHGENIAAQLEEAKQRVAFKNKSGKVRASRELFPLSDSLRIFYQEKEKRFLEKKPRSAKRSLAASKVNSI